MAITSKITNTEFADRIGCHYTMASRLFNGNRLPSIELMYRIEQEFGLSLSVQMAARKKGPEAYSATLRRHCLPD